MNTMVILLWITAGLVFLTMIVLVWAIARNGAKHREKKRLLDAIRKFINHPDNRELVSRGAFKYREVIELIGEDLEAAKRQLRVLGIPF